MSVQLDGCTIFKFAEMLGEKGRWRLHCFNQIFETSPYKNNSFTVTSILSYKTS